MRPPPLDVRGYVEGITAGDHAVLARAITLVESEREIDRAVSQEVLTALLPRTGQALRVGITGVPGVGKSTFIEALGTMLTTGGERVAVLAVDPSSERSGGSILGDKTRMARLAHDRSAFVRPSPSRGALGGVAAATREAMLLCEAAGFGAILVETVGVGQSETAVASIVDCFVVLLLPNAGDELQGIKRGILELADLVAVHKADGAQREAAERARSQYQSALAYLSPARLGWKVEVLCVSSLEGSGVRELWDRVRAHRSALEANGELARLRSEQAVRSMWAAVESELHAHLRADPAVIAICGALEDEVRRGVVPPTVAAARLLSAWQR